MTAVTGIITKIEPGWHNGSDNVDPDVSDFPLDWQPAPHTLVRMDVDGRIAYGFIPDGQPVPAVGDLYTADLPDFPYTPIY